MAPSDTDERLMSIDDVAYYLNIHRAGVYRLMQRGELPYILVGARRRIRRADMLQYVEHAS